MAFNKLPNSTPDQISGIPNPSIQELLLKRLVWPSAASEPKATLERPVPENHRHTQSIPFGLPDIDNDLPDRGLPRGAIHEFFYNDPLLPKAVASSIPILLAYNCLLSEIALRGSDRFNQATLDQKGPPSIVWIGRACWPTPQALNAAASSSAADGASFLANSLFIDPPNDTSALWAIELALKSQAISLVIAACPNISRQTTQRLAISARKYSTTALLLRSPDQIAIPSHASSRWEVSPTPANNNLSSTQSPCWSLRLLKLKGAAAKGQSWIVSINEPNPLLHSREPFSGYRVPTKHSETRTGLKSIFCSG